MYLFQASKRQPGTSGRLHRTVTGEWVWSSEEEDSSASSGDEGKEALPVNTIENASSTEEEPEEEFYGQVKSARSHIVVQATEPNVPINLVLRLRYIVLIIFYHFLISILYSQSFQISNFKAADKEYVNSHFSPFIIKQFKNSRYSTNSTSKLK